MTSHDASYNTTEVERQKSAQMGKALSSSVLAPKPVNNIWQPSNNNISSNAKLGKMKHTPVKKAAVRPVVGKMQHTPPRAVAQKVAQKEPAVAVAVVVAPIVNTAVATITTTTESDSSSAPTNTAAVEVQEAPVEEAATKTYSTPQDAKAAAMARLNRLEVQVVVLKAENRDLNQRMFAMEKLLKKLMEDKEKGTSKNNQPVPAAAATVLVAAVVEQPITAAPITAAPVPAPVPAPVTAHVTAPVTAPVIAPVPAAVPVEEVKSDSTEKKKAPVDVIVTSTRTNLEDERPLRPRTKPLVIPEVPIEVVQKKAEAERAAEARLEEEEEPEPVIVESARVELDLTFVALPGAKKEEPALPAAFTINPHDELPIGSSKAKIGSVPMMSEFPPETEAMAVAMAQCTVCSRKFSEKVLARHTKHCEKNFGKTRKIFKKTFVELPDDFTGKNMVGRKKKKRRAVR
jgi:hypothetical protein